MSAVELDPQLEGPRPPQGAGFNDTITVSFGDLEAGVFGLARAGLADGAASGLGVLFSGEETVAARAETGGAPSGRGWEHVQAGGVSTAVLAPLERWTVAFDGGAAGGFTLELTALGPPVATQGGGLDGYEQPCRVRGGARVGDREIAVDCLGQRGHAWGVPDWERLAMTRTLSAWIDDRLTVLISALRPAKAKGHDRDEISAFVLEGAPLAPVAAIDEPLLSTAYDEDGRQRRAGWELWPVAEDPEADSEDDDRRRGARRGAGELLCGTSLDLGSLRLECAFFRFRMEGREGVGRYDVLRPT
jgi:hypothetical protein